MKLKNFVRLVIREKSIVRNPILALKLFRVSRISRYTVFTTHALERPLHGVDSASFLYMFDEIFCRQIYHFECDNPRPCILDCGANIGLASLFWKRLFPQAAITAFEPDSSIADCFEMNMASFGFSEIAVERAAVWHSDESISFTPDGADAGRIDSEGGSNRTRAIRLRRYLDQHIDMLKLDIEGAETDVLADCHDKLESVDRMFVEYHSYVNKRQQLAMLIDVLSASGFRLKIEHVTIPRRPFVENPTYLGMDMNLNIFATRKR